MDDNRGFWSTILPSEMIHVTVPETSGSISLYCALIAFTSPHPLALPLLTFAYPRLTFVG
jgi:hypothetical protein